MAFLVLGTKTWCFWYKTPNVVFLVLNTKTWCFGYKTPKRGAFGMGHQQGGGGGSPKPHKSERFGLWSPGEESAPCGARHRCTRVPRTPANKHGLLDKPSSAANLRLPLVLSTQGPIRSGSWPPHDLTIFGFSGCLRSRALRPGGGLYPRRAYGV